MAHNDFAVAMAPRIAPVRRRQFADTMTYRFIFIVCFIVFLWAMALERLIPQRWRTLSDSHSTKSLWMAARNAAHRCTSIAFQG